MLQKNIVAGATSLCLCLWQITQVPGYSAAIPTRTSLNSPNINTYYRCTVVIQDKPKTRFGKWIHGVLAYYINFVHFEHKKVTDCSFKWFFFSAAFIVLLNTIKIPYASLLIPFFFAPHIWYPVGQRNYCGNYCSARFLFHPVRAESVQLFKYRYQVLCVFVTLNLITHYSHFEILKRDVIGTQ